MSTTVQETTEEVVLWMPGLEHLGMVFNAITGSYARAQDLQMAGVSGLTSDPESAVAQTPPDGPEEYNVPNGVAYQTQSIMNTDKLVGDVVTHWHRLSEGRRTVVFASGVQHSVHLRDEFRQSGVWAEHIDGRTPREERDEILGRLSRGEVDLVTNCMVLTEGWDQPDVSCVVLARPTKHMGLYRQMVGRVLRPAEGKADALVIDHAGAVFEHGFVEEPVLWTLDADRRAENPVHASRKKTSGLVTCPECATVYSEKPACPSCGHRHIPKGRAVSVRDGELGEVDRTGRVTKQQPTYQDRARWWRQLTWIATERGYNSGWTAHQYKAKFGAWPDGLHGDPEPPDPEVRAFVKHLQIRYAKSKQREQIA